MAKGPIIGTHIIFAEDNILPILPAFGAHFECYKVTEVKYSPFQLLGDIWIEVFGS